MELESYLELNLTVNEWKNVDVFVNKLGGGRVVWR